MPPTLPLPLPGGACPGRAELSQQPGVMIVHRLSVLVAGPLAENGRWQPERRLFFIWSVLVTERSPERMLQQRDGDVG